MPGWAQPYFSPDQVGLDRGLQWVLLIYKSRNLGSSATSIAQRLYVHTIGKTNKKAWPSQPALAGDLDIGSTNTVSTALGALEKDGWVVKGQARDGRHSYTLAWPAHDCLAPTADDSPVLCAQPTGKGSLCTRRAGWGTDHRGQGLCKLHDLTDDAQAPQPLRESDGQEDTSAPQPLRGVAGIFVPGTPQPLKRPTSTIEAAPPQPLKPAPSTVEDKYVREFVTGVRERSNEGCGSSVAEVEDPTDPERSTQPDFSLDDVKMADGWRAIARRKLGVDLGEDVDPEYLESYATALAYAEITSGTFRAPPWPDHDRIPA
jgi:hypothetical protein